MTARQILLQVPAFNPASGRFYAAIQGKGKREGTVQEPGMGDSLKLAETVLYPNQLFL